ncbi:MAG: hypothetical protein WCG06_03850, partial [Candidatus Omnitrophota bacterium]
MKSKLVNSSLSICLIMSIAAPAAVVDVAFAQITPVQSQITSLPEGTAPERFAASNENAQQMTDTRNALLEVQARSPQDILQGADISYPGMDVYLNADGTISRVDYLDMASGFLTAQDFYYSHTGRWTQVGNRLNDGSVQKKVMYTASQMRFREYFFNSDATLESVLFFDEVTGVNFSE